MINVSRKDKQVYILYGAVGYPTGLSNVVADVYNNADTKVENSLALSELDGLGLYGGSFTPSTTGDFKIVIYEGSLKKASATIYIGEYDIESNGSGIVSITSLLENATYGLDQAQVDRENISSDLADISDYLVDSIQFSIDKLLDHATAVATIPENMTIPNSGEVVSYKIYVNVYDEQGLPVDPYRQDIP